MPILNICLFLHVIEDNENPRMEFLVARKMSRPRVPKLKSIALDVDSTWGEPGDYGCLYRFRVHGEEDE